MRVGGSTKVSVDIRLVCATLRPLESEVQAGRFRADLYYRIEGITLHIPPLRERPSDIAPLALQFIAELSAFHGVKPPRLGRSALATLQGFGWPGNVRQLRNAMERICLLRPGLPARLEDLPRALQGSPTQADGKRQSIEIPLDQHLEKTIHQLLVAVLESERGNRARTAKKLGVSLRTVQRHLARNPP